MKEEVADSRSPTTNLEDTALVAYMAYRGHKIKPWYCRESDTVSFDVEGDEMEIEAGMKEYYDNGWVEIQDYVQCLKSIKSMMYNMKKTLKTGGLK